jgi:phage/plasmid-associated DNA primase
MTTFNTKFKLVVCLNELMKIDDTSHGAWRRIRVVEFESLFTEQPKTDDPEKPFQFKLDPKITEKFEKWKTVLMAMLVKRACESQGKVPDCDKVMKASKEYEKSQDYLAEFIDDHIIRDPNGQIKKSEINNEFKIWFAVNGGTSKANPKELHAKMDKLFGKNKGKEGWKGVRILYNRANGSGQNSVYSDSHSENTNDVEDDEFNGI